MSYVLHSHGKTSIPGWVFNIQGLGVTAHALTGTKRTETKERRS